MPPSPYKRNRRMKSRLMAGSEDDRVNLRTKAVEMMRRTGGAMAPDDSMASHPRPKTSGRGPKPPIDPYAPRRTGDGGRATHPRPTTTGLGPKPGVPTGRPRGGDVIRGTNVPKGPDGRPISRGHVPVRPAAPRPHPSHGDVIRRSPPRPVSGPVIRLKPESGGTGNHAAPQTAIKNDTLDKGARRPVAKRPASAYDNRLSSLARQRALSGNRNNTGTRALMSVATRDTDTGGAAWRQSRAYRMGRSIQRRRARRWLRNTAQGPSRPQYT